MKKDWIEVELGTVCDFKGGGTPSKSNPDFWDGEIPWASIKDIKGDYLLVTKDFITKEGLDKSASNLVLENEIILATRINPGRAIISKIKTAINQDLKIVKPLIPFSEKFLFYVFKSIEPKVLKVSSGTTVLGVNLTNLKEINVPVLPIPEQRAIVSRIEELFSDLDHAISNLQSAQAKLEIYRQAVLKRAFEANEDFKNLTVEECCSYIVDCLHSTAKFKPSGYYCIDTTCIEDSKISFEKARFVDEETYLDRIRRLKPVENDILFSREGTVGKAVIVPPKLDLCLGQRMMMFRLKNGILPKFFQSYILSPGFKALYKPLIGGTTSPHLNIRDIRKLIIPVFSPETQTSIVQEIESRLSVADKLAETIETNLKKSESLRQSILKKAFEGELLTEAELEACRKEADWEPAEKLLERIKGEKGKK